MKKEIDEDRLRYVLEHINDRPRTQVAKAAGISLSMLYRIVREHNGQLDYRLCRAQDDITRRITELYPTHTGSECAKMLGLARSTVIRWARRLNLQHTPETLQRINEERKQTLARCRENMDIQKRVRTWKRHRRMDEIRFMSGLKQNTRFHMKIYPRRVYTAMYYLCCKYGYVFSDYDYFALIRPHGRVRQKTEEYFAAKYKIKFKDKDNAYTQ